MNKKLKPCPFCGGKHIECVVKRSKHVYLPFKARAECTHCCANSQWVWVADREAARAATAEFWNMRAQPPEDPKRCRASERF